MCTKKSFVPRCSELFGDEGADAIRILYGGSVTAANAAEFFAYADIDGALGRRCQPQAR